VATAASPSWLRRQYSRSMTTKKASQTTAKPTLMAANVQLTGELVKRFVFVFGVLLLRLQMSNQLVFEDGPGCG
jgi:hypothetical protein